jgi:hypothetical protein
MGVLAVYARWHAESPNGDPNFDEEIHQFYYIDCEEQGLESCRVITDGDSEDLDIIEQALVGGLGAKKIDITLSQFQAIIAKYRDFNIAKGLSLPENYDEFKFVLDGMLPLSEAEEEALMKTICTDITTDYQVINYFLMRCFGQDEEGAAFLAAPQVPLDVYSNYIQATFCKNVIDIDEYYDDGAIGYMCESLVEMNGNHETIISRVVVKDLKVVHMEHCSGFHVSPAEAAMMLSKGEFVTVYEVLLSDEDMEANIDELALTLDAVKSHHPNGCMFMSFKSNNDHVDSHEFRMNSDMNGIFFLTNYGQLIVTAYNLRTIRQLENKLKMSLLAPYLMLTSKYEFKNPVLLEFIQSDFEDFEDFLDTFR